ncbi:hypothetical protein DFS33DRAFT_885203 [Desarmillaria ectypa]|nr:hypothetical protein DFS33DRAFT_885203 [Desarmillaria ectypa]
MYVMIQLAVIEMILVLRVWVITGNQRWILWSFFGFIEAGVAQFTLALLFEGIIFAATAHRRIQDLQDWRSLLSSNGDALRLSPKPIMQLMFQDSVLYFLTVVCALPIVVFLDIQLGLTIMSVAVTRMLLRVRRQALPDTAGERFSQEELTTFSAALRER